MFRSKSQFEKVLDKATSNLLLEPDFDAMLQLCDMIRGGDIKAREAVAHMKARIREEKNPNVQYFALSVLDTAMKNCGEAVHEEVITQTFLEEMKDMVKAASADRVKAKILEMVQSWGLAFKEKTEFRIATNLYNIMKTEGYEFQTPTNTADMFKAETAPVWKEGDECSKCKTEFGLVQRKHHCRACGGIFCNRCTSKQSIVPKFGIEKEVRVCDKCYDEINSKTSTSTSDSSGLPAEYLNSSLAKESQVPQKRSEQELKEEEELQIALAMSLNEQENQPKSQIKDMPVYASVNKTQAIQPEVKVSASDSDLDPELARYLNRNYWEKKKDTQEKQEPKTEPKKTTKSSAPPAETQPEPVVIAETASEPKEPPKAEENLQNGEIEDNEEFMHSLRTSVEIFMNRMRSDQMRNRSIANDSSVQSLFQSINTMHPTLLQYMNDLEEKRLHYEALQDKLTQIRDARAALDALREEHKEKMRRAAEEAERIRQIQMAQKLEIMRQKKQEYLAYQRQIALQRMQEQEAARHARLEKQKQFIMQRAMQPAMLVQGYNTQYMPPQPNIGETAPEMQQPGMQPAAYPPYGPGQGYQQQPATMAPPGGAQPPYTQQMAMAAPPGQPQYHQPQMQQPHSGQFQPHMAAGYQQGIPDQVAPPQMQGATYTQESFNMAGMASALPQQANPNMQGQQQVVATAPPPTPQATPTPQQMSQTHVTQAHMMQMGGPQHQQMPPGQQYYQPPQDQVPPPQQQPPVGMTPQQAQDLLISFD